MDGCGILHPQGFGAACHLGVVTGLPTVGVAKNLLFVEGLDRKGVHQALQEPVIGLGQLQTEKGVGAPVSILENHKSVIGIVSARMPWTPTETVLCAEHDFCTSSLLCFLLQSWVKEMQVPLQWPTCTLTGDPVGDAYL